MAQSTEPVTIDSGKFLSTINNSAQSKIAIYEQAVNRLGKKVGANWQLAALLNDRLFIENVDTGVYYQAEHAKARGGSISISNVVPLKIVESRKSTTYEQHCTDLVNAIEENDQRGMKSAWSNLTAHRFSPRTIPHDGIVKTRDGVMRKVVVEGTKIDDAFKNKLVKAFVESVTDTVVLEGETIVRAIVNDFTKKLPISEWTCRKVVAEQMRDVAKKAYMSQGFQGQVHNIAYLIDRDKIDEAVQKAVAFFTEWQEFGLLTGKEMLTLVENTLAAKAVLNQNLCEDTAALMHGACLRALKNDIISEWRTVARKSQHPALLENVIALEKSSDFAESYDKFINAAFNEAISPRDEEISAYRTALSLLKDTPQVREDKELRVKIEELLSKLHGTEVDNATVNLVREALAAAKKEVDQVQDLDDYDALPGEDGSLGAEVEDAMEAGGGLGAGSGVPNIVINAPLISIGGADALGGGQSGGMGLGSEPDGDEGLGDEDMGLGDEGDEFGGEEEDEFGGDEFGGEEDEDDELSGMFGGGEDEDEEDEFAGFESRKRGKAVTESGFDPDTITSGGDGIEDDDYDPLDGRFGPFDKKKKKSKKGFKEDKDWFKKNVLKKGDDKKDDKAEDKDDSDDDCEEDCNESFDYGFNSNMAIESGVGNDYGRPVLEGEIPDLVVSMFDIIEERGLSVDDVDKNLDKLAEEVIEAFGIHIPDHRRDAAVNAVSDAFCRHVLQLEDQYKWGTVLRRRGFRRSSLAATEKKRKVSESKQTTAELVCEAHDEANQGCLGVYRGVKFVLDYADPPIVTSESGRGEVPLPSDLTESALAAFAIGPGDEKPFLEWLDSNIEQFRPISDDEERELLEAVATITAGPDGTISVSVDGDVNVDQGAGGLGGDDEMQPIVDMGADEAVGEPGVDSVPDFEGDGGDELTGEPPIDGEEAVVGSSEEEIGGEVGGEVGGGGEIPAKAGEDDEEGPVKEDKDITDPTKSDYDTSGQDLRAQSKEAGKAVKGEPSSKLDGFEKGKVDAPNAPTNLTKVKVGKNTIK